jgi:hypothetical protein
MHGTEKESVQLLADTLFVARSCAQGVGTLVNSPVTPLFWTVLAWVSAHVVAFAVDVGFVFFKADVIPCRCPTDSKFYVISGQHISKALAMEAADRRRKHEDVPEVMSFVMATVLYREWTDVVARGCAHSAQMRATMLGSVG